MKGEEWKRAIMNYELWVMNYELKKRKEMPANWTTETNKRIKSNYELWVMNYELKSGEGWREKGDEKRTGKEQLWIMS